MDAIEIITKLSAAGIRLRPEGENIRAIPSSALTDDTRALIKQHKAALLEALNDGEVSDHWLIIAAPPRLEKWFTPAIGRRELAALYPGAALVPIQTNATRPATEKQKAELTILVSLVAAASGFTQAEHAEALDRAVRDPESALVSFRALARELGVLEERSRGCDSVRLWITIQTKDGPQRVAVDIPKGKFDGVALLEMFEKHRKAGTTRVINIETERQS